MNTENTNKLLFRFPILYRQDFSFEIGDGWFDIIYHLSEEIEVIYSKEFTNTNIASIGIVNYTKSKFGFLKFNMKGYNNGKVEQAIIRSIDKALYTCERCSSKYAKHRIMSGGYEAVYCDDCEKAYNNEY